MRKAPSGISVGKEKLKCKNDLTSLDDKIRIANKVNSKYLKLGSEKSDTLESMTKDVGEEALTVLENGNPTSNGNKKGGKMLIIYLLVALEQEWRLAK